MEQYTIRGFKEVFEESIEYLALADNEDRLEYLDKCNWVISYIISTIKSRNKPLNYYVNISSESLTQFLGSRHYNYILKSLIGLDYIRRPPKYQSGKFSKSCFLTDKALSSEIITTEVFSDKFKNRVKKIKDKEYEECFKEPVLKKILNNTAKLIVVESEDYYKEKITILTEQEMDNNIDPDEKIRENKQRYYRYKAFYNEFKALNNVNSAREVYDSKICFKPSVAKSGRIYHTVASIPRYIRHSMRANENDLIWEVDMSAAQPSVLLLEWLKTSYLKGYSSTIEKEFNLCKKLIIDGDIYRYISDNSEYFKRLKYSELKKETLSALYEEDLTSVKNIELLRLFPSFMSWLNSIKQKEGYKIASHIGQSIEANIFVNVFKQLPDDRFFLIIHDSILCTEGDKELVKEKLIGRTKELFSEIISKDENLDKLFKINRVSIKDEDLEDNKNPRLLKEYLQSIGEWEDDWDNELNLPL